MTACKQVDDTVNIDAVAVVTVDQSKVCEAKRLAFCHKDDSKTCRWDISVPRHSWQTNTLRQRQRTQVIVTWEKEFRFSGIRVA